MTGHPKPVAISGITQNKLSRMPGAFSGASNIPIPQDMDVEEFACAMVRFENGATLISEVAWMLHHANHGEDMQMWLYGTQSGCHWPSNQILSANNKTKRLHDTHLNTIQDDLELHAAE